MANFANMLKDEVARIARREVRAQTAALQGASRRYRSDIAELKRQVAALSKSVKQSSKVVSKSTRTASGATAEKKTRFSAKSLISQRRRLGLSQEALGKLLEVSALSIYNWESGNVRPRDQYLPAIAKLKSLGRKSATAILESR